MSTKKGALGDNNVAAEVRRLGVLIEQMIDQQQAMLEGMASSRSYMKEKLAKEDDLQALQDDIKIIKRAVTDTNKDLHILEKRIDTLEAGA